MSLSGHGSLRGRCEPPHDGVGSAGLVMSTTRSIRAWRLMAATVPTRWPVLRPDEGRPSAASGGSRGVAIGCSCRVDLLCRPAEFAAIAQHAMEDGRELPGHGDGGFLVPIASPGVSPRPSAPTTRDTMEVIPAAHTVVRSSCRRSGRCGRCSPPRRMVAPRR